MGLVVITQQFTEGELLKKSLICREDALHCAMLRNGISRQTAYQDKMLLDKLCSS